MNNPWQLDFVIAAAHSGLVTLPERFWDWPVAKKSAWATPAAEKIAARKDDPAVRAFFALHGSLIPPPEPPAVESSNDTSPSQQRWNLPRPTIRNLIYHVCPLATNDTWRANVRQLLRRWDAFSGRRVVAIAFGEGLLPPSAVREAFAGHDCEFLELPNDRDLREVATFLPLLISVANQDEQQATLYAHTKGNSTEGSNLGSMYWRNEMYHRLLDHWQECMAALENAAAVGIHKIRWPDNVASIYPTRLECGKWMFAGTFFWFRHDLVFGHHCWRRLSIDRYGAEAWLAGLFTAEQVKSVYQLWPEERFPTPSPYDPTIYPNPIRD